MGQVERVEGDDTVGEIANQSGCVRVRRSWVQTAFGRASYVGTPRTHLASVDSAYSLRPSGASLRLEMPCGRVVSVFMTASSFVSYVAGLTRRLCDRRRSQILTTLQIYLSCKSARLSSSAASNLSRLTRQKNRKLRANAPGAANEQRWSRS